MAANRSIEPAKLGKCEVVKETEMAILVCFDDGDYENCEIWIPKSVIHDTSEVTEARDNGELIVFKWWQDEKNL